MFLWFLEVDTIFGVVLVIVRVCHAVYYYQESGRRCATVEDAMPRWQQQFVGARPGVWDLGNFSNVTCIMMDLANSTQVRWPRDPTIDGPDACFAEGQICEVPAATHVVQDKIYD